MRRNSHNLENALRILESVLDDGVSDQGILLPDPPIGKLVVSHAIIQAHPTDFFVQDTKHLVRPYSWVLDFLVGNGLDLATVSRRLGWHEAAKPMEGQAARDRRQCLTTPPQILDLLLRHSNTGDVTLYLFKEAKDRQEAQHAAATPQRWKIKPRA